MYAREEQTAMIKGRMQSYRDNVTYWCGFWAYQHFTYNISVGALILFSGNTCKPGELSVLRISLAKA